MIIWRYFFWLEEQPSWPQTEENLFLREMRLFLEVVQLWSSAWLQPLSVFRHRWGVGGVWFSFQQVRMAVCFQKLHPCRTISGRGMGRSLSQVSVRLHWARRRAQGSFTHLPRIKHTRMGSVSRASYAGFPLSWPFAPCVCVCRCLGFLVLTHTRV